MNETEKYIAQFPENVQDIVNEIRHIGFYATPTGHEEFKKELSVYKQGKGSVQFPIKDEIPYQLIRKIVKFRKNEFQKL